MEIILLEKVQNLGDLGDQVNVRPGYARNYLIPQKKAVHATPEAKAAIEERRRELEQAAMSKVQAAQERAEKLQGATVQIARMVGEEGKLFGSVSTTDIAEAMQQMGFELSKSEIHLPDGPLKEVGDHEVSVSLHPEVHLNIIVSVLAET